ncbi:MAG: hypothetical protein U0640_06855 [Phycisphaerales bacterium]
MSELDLMEWLGQEEAELVLLTTFGLDPMFFERRVLPSKALAHARRILVLMDANEWGKILASREPIRSLNQRYLVVPVSRRAGAFHPKVGLLLSEARVRGYCGSANLTRAGFTFNIELINCVSTEISNDSPPATQPLIGQAFGLFEQIAADASGNGASLARQWLSEARVRWRFNEPYREGEFGIELLDTVGQGLMDQVRSRVGPAVEEILLVSPFWDDDLRLLKQFRQYWPNASVRVVAQSGTSNLDPAVLRGFMPDAVVESPVGAGRVLHAKLAAWRTANRWACLVGSANCTEAAWAGRNVEACVFIADATSMVEQLFGDGVTIERLGLDVFEKGSLTPPERTGSAAKPSLSLTTAHLAPSGLLSVTYTVQRSEELDQLAIGIRGPGDVDPAFTAPVARRDEGEAIVQLPESISGASGATLRASLIAVRRGNREEGLPLWVVQERRLTIDRGESDERALFRRAVETGEGLPELADEVLQRQGVHGLVEFLRSTTIRFVDTSDKHLGSREFTVRIHDPYRESQIPEWLSRFSPADYSQLKAALIDFAERHERQRLRRHAKAGNVNGLENYLDILRAVVRLLFIWYRRGRFPATRLIGQFCRLVELSSVGIDERDDNCPGMLLTTAKNLRADRELLQQRLDEFGFVGAIDGVLWLARVARANEAGVGTRRIDQLQVWERKLLLAIREAKVMSVDTNSTLLFLDRLGVATNEELKTWRAELEARNCFI